MQALRRIVGLLFLAILQSCALADPSADAGALLDFLHGISSNAQALVSWNVSSVDGNGCPQGWSGVSCSEYGRVVGLDLGGFSLGGQISPNTLGLLKQLTSLNLSHNFFSGSVPDDFGSLPALLSMDLSSNGFVGHIPTSFGSLQTLTNLSLGSNQFDGGIPYEVAGLPQLLQLDLSHNLLSGVIPPSLGELRNLVSLNLSFNDLSGMVSFDGFLALEVLDLRGNNLSGDVDESWLLMPLVKTVDLSSNMLTSNVSWLINPSSLPSSLEYLNLSNNFFSVALSSPAATFVSASLEVLDVSHNQFTGQLPSIKLDRATTLRFGNNNFSGRVPSELYSQVPLKELDLSANQFAGPMDKVTSTTLRILNLSSNLLLGKLPSKFESISLVDLSRNNFSGSVSDISGWGSTMEVIDLSWNSLTGSLPDDAPAFLAALRSLNLSHNDLFGEIPSGFTNFTRLEALDLSSNSLDGSVPAFLFNLSITRLILSDNAFTGSIDIPDFESAAVIQSPLVVVNLSSNQLTGPIPPLSMYFPNLFSLDLSNNSLSGPIPSNLSSLQDLHDLDLSFNQLTGPIPSELGLIPGLIGLNLSNNNLSGTLPASLERFPRSSFANNPQLKFMNGSTISGSDVSHGKKGNRSAVEAGLIGGSTAAAAILLAAGLFLYYRNMSKSQVVMARSPEYIGRSKSEHNHLRAGGLQENESGSPSGSEAASSGTVKLKGILKGHSYRASPEPAVEEPKSVEGNGKSDVPSPVPYVHLQPQGHGEAVPPEQPVVLRVCSPERLAGDLFLLDTSIVFTAEELSRAPAEVLGRSSHGTSYKATLDSGHVLTVKWLREGLAKSRKKFIGEARKFGNVKHPNVMALRGYYWGPREHEKLLVSDFIPSGSLAGRLYERTGRRYAPLSWQQRLRIAVDISRGLNYLQLEHQLPHGNLKATNVLLDGPNLDGRLADFSLHRLVTEAGTANTILNAGALGYRSSELASSKKPKPSFEADVYAFGVILMEILTGKGAGDIISGNSGAVDLPDWVRLLANEGRAVDCFDPALVGVHRDQEPPKGMDDMLAISLSCIATRTLRPNIRVIYEKLAAINPSQSD